MPGYVDWNALQQSIDDLITALEPPVSASTGQPFSLAVGAAAVAVRAGAANEAGRKQVVIINNSDSVVYYGFSAAVAVASGLPIAAGSAVSVRVVDDTVDVYLIAGAAGKDCRCVEVL